MNSDTHRHDPLAHRPWEFHARSDGDDGPLGYEAALPGLQGLGGATLPTPANDNAPWTGAFDLF